MLDGQVRHYKIFYFPTHGYSLGGEEAEFFPSTVREKEGGKK